MVDCISLCTLIVSTIFVIIDCHELFRNQTFMSNEIESSAVSSIEDTTASYVKRMVKKWSPLVWLAPSEKYLPMDVQEFLQHIVSQSRDGELHDTLPVGLKSESSFLVSNISLDKLLQNSSSFLHGHNPNRFKVPVYARVSICGYKHFHVTYWFFFPFSQGKTMCTLNISLLGPVPIPRINDHCYGSLQEFGSHVGDWEHTSFYFKGEDEPAEMYVSAHDAGAFYTFDAAKKAFVFKKQEIRKGFIQRPNFPAQVKLQNDSRGLHPVLFAARGSHGLWTAPGEHRYVRLPRLYDISGYGIAWRTWENIITLQTKETWPRWMFYMGKWGNTKTNCHPLSRMGINICQFVDGPGGIPTKIPNFSCNMN